MKEVKILSIFLTLLIVCNTSCQNSENLDLTLFSNQVPVDTPLIFGQGIISTDNFEFAITFNPEMNKLYFTRRKPGEENEIYTMKLIDGKWSEAELAFFRFAIIVESTTIPSSIVPIEYRSYPTLQRHNRTYVIKYRYLV